VNKFSVFPNSTFQPEGISTDNIGYLIFAKQCIGTSNGSLKGGLKENPNIESTNKSYCSYSSTIFCYNIFIGMSLCMQVEISLLKNGYFTSLKIPTTESKPSIFKCLAATIPSPPLLPGPHNTNTFLIFLLSLFILYTVLAILYPANSIKMSKENPTSSDINSTSNS